MNNLLVTLDTCVLDRWKVRRLRDAARPLPVRFRNTSIAPRELKNAKPRVRFGVRPLSAPRQLVEGCLLGESLLGQFVLWPPGSGARFEQVLHLMSNGSFPKPGQRDDLTNPQRNQLRDAHHLMTHAHAGGAIFITEDTTGFGRPGSPLRHALEALCSTQIMTPDEFCASCDGARRQGDHRRFRVPQDAGPSSSE